MYRGCLVSALAAQDDVVGMLLEDRTNGVDELRLHFRTYTYFRISQFSLRIAATGLIALYLCAIDSWEFYKESYVKYVRLAPYMSYQNCL